MEQLRQLIASNHKNNNPEPGTPPGFLCATPIPTAHLACLLSLILKQGLDQNRSWAVEYTLQEEIRVNIFGIGLPEMAVIMTVALLIFGPKKLPEIGRSMGKAIRSFQEASREFETEFKREAEHLDQTVKTTAELEPKQIAADKAEENFSPQLSSTAEAENHAATTLEQS